MILFHASYNSTLIFLQALWVPGKPVVPLPEWALGSIVAALLVMVIGRHSLFRRSAPNGAHPVEVGSFA